jgi:hypothetical protein
MDRFEKGAVPDRQDGERMDSIVQTRDWTASGGGRKTTGDQGKLTASTAVESTRGDQLIIKVGAIGCSAFSLNKCSLGSV